METHAEQFCVGSRFREVADGPLAVELGDAAELRHHEVDELVAIVVEPHRQAATEVHRGESPCDRAVHESLVLVDHQLAQVAGACAHEQVLVAVVVEVGPRTTVRIRLRPVLPRERVATGLMERAVAHVQEQARLLPVIAREDVEVGVAVQVAPGGAVAFACASNVGRLRYVGECDLCIRCEWRSEADRRGER